MYYQQNFMPYFQPLDTRKVSRLFIAICGFTDNKKQVNYYLKIIQKDIVVQVRKTTEKEK